MRQLTNRTYDEIDVGANDTVVRTLTATDVEALALAAGDVETFHLDLAPGAVAEAATAPGAAAVALVAGVLNRRLPGPGSAIVGSQFRYQGKVRAGDTLTVSVTARAKHAEGHRIEFDCRCTNAEGDVLVEGIATVAAPSKHIAYTNIATPEVMLRRNDGLARLLQRCLNIAPVAAPSSIRATSIR